MEGDRRKHLCRLSKCGGRVPKLGTECRALPKPDGLALSGCRYWYCSYCHANGLGAAFSAPMELRQRHRAKAAADAEVKKRKSGKLEEPGREFKTESFPEVFIPVVPAAFFTSASVATPARSSIFRTSESSVLLSRADRAKLCRNRRYRY
jgi:hypothetical protein